uniref:Uncharacterized protein n=1 Tax=Arundo donax TaxID=35708 RepID=A0A0A9D5J2_ARUDO
MAASICPSRSECDAKSLATCRGLQLQATSQKAVTSQLQ